ncbi:MAG: DUF2341 domain-containing protein, partial [Chitinispirillaceae bacterium]|nr:DUF2341 domain-containing protein [Chitinispirillaceae bacterium]
MVKNCGEFYHDAPHAEAQHLTVTEKKVDVMRLKRLLVIKVVSIVALIVSASYGAAYFWDTSADGGYQAGDGTWSTSDAYWSLTGTPLVVWPGVTGNSATFAGSDGTYAITVSNTQNVDSIAFNNSGYTISGGTAIYFGTKKGISVASGKSATITTPITGSGGITKTGAGTLIFNGGNTYTGTTTISAGTLRLTSNGGIENTSPIVLADIAGAIFDINNTTEIVASIAGGGTNGGNINLGGSSGHIWCGVDNSSTTYGGVISNSGQVTKQGSGTLTLTGANTYTGSTNISAGTLSIGSGGTTGSVVGNIANSSALTFNRSNTLSYGGVISGSGSMTKTGAGALTLSGTNTYTGTTTVLAGSLLVTGSLASGSAVTVASGATLGGTGTVSGTVAANGAISAGTTGYGTLTIGNSLTFSSSGSLVAALGGTTAGTNYDQVVMSTGTLTLANATLSLSLGFAASVSNTFTVINNAGSNAVSGTFNGISQGGSTDVVYGGMKYTFTVSYTGGTGNDVVLTCASILANDYTWDTSSTAGIQKGAGTWGTNNYWTVSSGDGTSLVAWPGVGYSATFAGDDNARTITVSTTRNVDSITISNSGYTFSGGTSINFGTKKGIYIASGKSATFATPIAGSGGICLTGGGTLITSANNTYTGPTTITAGTLQLNTTNERIPNTSSIVFADVSSAAFNVNGRTETVRSLAGGGQNGGNISLGGGVLIINSDTATSYGGVISGTGPLTKSGTGTQRLTRKNSYTGITTISGGTLAVDTLDNGGSASGIGISTNAAANLVIDNAILEYTGSGASTDRLFSFSSSNGGSIYSSGTGAVNFTNTGSITVAGTTPTLTLGGTYTGGANTFSLILADPGGGPSNKSALIKTGNSTWIITGTQLYDGATTVSDGTLTITGSIDADSPISTSVGGNLQVGNGGTTGQINSNVANSGTVTFYRSDPITYGVLVISGSGGVVKQGPSSLTFTNAQTFTGDVTITEGSLHIGASTTGGSIVANVVNNDTILFNRSNDYTYAGDISGTGMLIKWGAGLLTLTGTNTYSGITYNVDGTGIQIGNGGTTGSISGNIVSNNPLTFNRSDTYTYGGVISTQGSCALTKSGSGTLIFTGNNTYTGTTTISSGTLQIGNNGTSGAIVTDVSVSSGAYLAFSRSDAYTYGGIISDAGSVTKAGSGALTLSNANTYTGATTVSAGTLFVNGSLASGSAVTVNADATLGGTGTINGTVSVSGTLEPGSGGTGTLTINNNTLSFSSGSELDITAYGTTAGADHNQVSQTGTGTVALNGNATLSFTIEYMPALGDTFVIIDNDATDAITGTFNGLASGDTVTAEYDGTPFKSTISYTGGTGNDVVLKVVKAEGLEDYGEWAYSKAFTLNTTVTGADVANNVPDFPVLLRLNPDNFPYFSQTLPGGADVRFAKGNGQHLRYAVERWVDNTGNNDTAEIWVKLDTVYGNSATQSFVMYWGKAGASDSSKSTSVFETTNGFVGVWHLDEDPSGGSGAMKDVTTNGLNGTSS